LYESTLTAVAARELGPTAAAGMDLQLMIGPKGTINGQVFGLRSDWIDDTAAGGRHFYQRGYATYDDVFDACHRTEFCLARDHETKAGSNR
jgi:hypothetical protein